MYKAFLGLCLVIFSGFIFGSCANTTAPPPGGDKDTIPPLIVEMLPPLNSINHFREGKFSKISIEFNEYVVIKDQRLNFFLSPPQEKPLEAQLKGKKVIFSFPEPLDSNTTYSLSLGDGIEDNNEGNLFPRFVYTFSTGDTIDSLFTSGSVYDASNVLPIKNVLVGFYLDQSDSTVFNSRPNVAIKSDDWGYFTARNMKSEPYQVYAFTDENNNYKYDPVDEMIGFLDSLYTPNLVINDSLPQLLSFDVKDTLACLSRPSEMEIYLFREISTRQFLRDNNRASARLLTLKFAAPNTQIDTLFIEGIDSLVTEFNITKDSLTAWIYDQKPILDTLNLHLEYQATDDSLNILVPKRDTLKMIRPKGKMIEDRYGRMVEESDSIAKYNLISKPENIDQDGFILEFEYPLLKAPFDSIQITSTNARMEEILMEYSVIPDSTNNRRYSIKLKEKMVAGSEYKFKFPHRLFVDINGLPCDSIETNVSLPVDEKLGSITLEMSNVNSTYIVELLDIRRTTVFRKYIITKDEELLFPYLSAANYSVRITEDKNNNGIVDTGSILDKKQPEKVLLFKVKDVLTDEAYALELPENVDLVQTIDIEKMFK